MSLKKTENIFVLAIFLAATGIIAASILSYFAQLTKEPIKEMQQAKINQALQEVLPEFDNVPSSDTIGLKSDDSEKYEVTFYGAKKDGKLVAVAGQSKTLKGYAGEIEAMVGLDVNGKIRTVIITKQGETPGLGTVVCDRKRQVTIFTLFSSKKDDESKLPPNPILDQFDGHVADKQGTWSMPWKVKKDGGNVNFITGATISSRAVTDVVYRIAHTYIANKDEIVKKLEAEKVAPQAEKGDK
jgi:electron transport complex protein RnfG